MDDYNKILTEAVEKFPYDPAYPYNKDNIRKVLELSMMCKPYKNAYSNFVDRLDEMYDFYNSPEYNDDELRSHYFDWGGLLSQWKRHYLPMLYTSRYPVKRTFEKAAEIYADQWVKLIFKRFIQDTGSDEPIAKKANLMGSILKTDAMAEVTEEQIEKFRDGCIKCILENKDFPTMGVDYDPDEKLYKILKDAGIPEKRISSICPWKTFIYIDTVDNVVYIHQNSNETHY